ncbi:hypothetical protein [Phocaeicola plebeius]
MRTKVNIVSSFMFYMWNRWSREECMHVFNNDPHFWNKWEYACENGTMGAAERFYAELSDHNREVLVNRACELYDGNRNRPITADTVQRTHRVHKNESLQGPA